MPNTNETPPPQRISVLLIDDEPLVLSSMLRGLRRFPAAVRLAATAEEALVLVAAQTPDLVVSDYRMPGTLTGLELLLRILQEHPEVVCVLHTAEFEVRVPVGAAIEVLTKPRSASALEKLVERTLAVRRGTH